MQTEILTTPVVLMPVDRTRFEAIFQSALEECANLRTLLLPYHAINSLLLPQYATKKNLNRIGRFLEQVAKHRCKRYKYERTVARIIYADQGIPLTV